MMGARPQGGDQLPGSHTRAGGRDSSSKPPVLALAHHRNPIFPSLKFAQAAFNICGIYFAASLVGITAIEITVVLLIIFFVGV